MNKTGVGARSCDRYAISICVSRRSGCYNGSIRTPCRLGDNKYRVMGTSTDTCRQRSKATNQAIGSDNSGGAADTTDDSAKMAAKTVVD